MYLRGSVSATERKAGFLKKSTASATAMPSALGVDAREEAVVLPPERGDGRRAEVDVPCGAAREVHAEERVPDVGHRVDVAVHREGGVLAELAVDALERDEPEVRARPKDARHAVAQCAPPALTKRSKPISAEAGHGHGGRRAGPVKRQLVTMRTRPVASRSARSAASTAFGSTTAVSREKSACPRCGPRARCPRAAARRSNSTLAPFAVARRCSSSRWAAPPRRERR